MSNASLEALRPSPGTGPTQQPEPGAPEDWRRFFSFSTDHKVIGIQYIVTAFVFFLFGGLLAMVMRGELITPASDLV
ncbi:MAG: cytochrome c oxidase subunit I, partial [Cyanobacteria bacterium J06632_3]